MGGTQGARISHVLWKYCTGTQESYAGVLISTWENRSVALQTEFTSLVLTDDTCHCYHLFGLRDKGVLL